MSEQKPYVVSARKYRPATFKSVVGQRALTATLKNAIDSGRLAQAYLFCGPRGVGKTSCARIFAKTINCLSPTPDGEACGVCESCRAIDKGNSFNLVELDAASNNSVDDIRSITEQVNVPPQSGRYRVFIIDEVHMLSNAAFNAFLKTLEEPPKYVVFILATTEKHKVIPTILSRCQIYDFKRITIDDMVDHLEYVASEEGISTERDALGVIALKADGAMRDALSIFDQVAASSRGQVTYQNTIENLNVLDYDYYFRFVDAFAKGDVPEALLIYKEIRDKGFDSLFMVNGLAAHIRDLMVAVDPRTASLLETSEEIAKRYTEQARMLPPQWYYSAIRLLSDCDINYRTATSKRLLVELTLIRLSQLRNPAPQPRQGGSQPQQGAPQQIQPTRPAARPQQQPQQATRPQPQSQSQPQPQPSPRQQVQRPTTMRLSDIGSSTGNNAGRTTQRTRPVKHEGFLQAWGEFMARNPQLHILVNAMRSATPAPAEGNAYSIVVDNPAQLQAFEMSMPKLIEYLRNSLENDLLTLKVEVNKNPVENRHLPPKEFLRQAVTENPSLAGFLSALDAELV